MLRRSVVHLCGVLSMLCATSVVSAAPTVIDFDLLSDGDVLTNQVAGIVFSNATVLSAGWSLNDSDYPPRSSANVVLDTGGQIVIDFASPVVSVGGYFTYVTQLTLSAYDAGLNLVASDSSDFLSNLASSGEVGSSPNEYIGVSAPGTVISRIIVKGSAAGDSFVLDDLTFEFGDEQALPEPDRLVLLATALVAASLARRRPTV